MRGMRPIKLWRLMDRFQNFDVSLNAQSEWVSAEEALAHGDEKARAERLRIRRELEKLAIEWQGPSRGDRFVYGARELMEALDRICPKDHSMAPG